VHISGFDSITRWPDARCKLAYNDVRAHPARRESIRPNPRANAASADAAVHAGCRFGSAHRLNAGSGNIRVRVRVCSRFTRTFGTYPPRTEQMVGAPARSRY